MWTALMRGLSPHLPTRCGGTGVSPDLIGASGHTRTAIMPAIGAYTTRSITARIITGRIITDGTEVHGGDTGRITTVRIGAVLSIMTTAGRYRVWLRAADAPPVLIAAPIPMPHV